jgi:hypothetical protein
MVVCGFFGCTEEVAETVDAVGSFFFPKKFIMVASCCVASYYSGSMLSLLPLARTAQYCIYLLLKSLASVVEFSFVEHNAASKYLSESVVNDTKNFAFGEFELNRASVRARI